MTNDIERVLKESPTMLRVMQCWNLVSYFKTDKTDLTEFLIKSDNFNMLLNLLHKSADMNVVKVIQNLFLASNTSLLFQFVSNKENMNKLIAFLEIPQAKKRPKQYAMNVCLNILNQAFITWPNEMFSNLNNSIDVVSKLLSNLTMLSVESFCMSIIEKSALSRTFVWIVFKHLMGNFGTGGQTPLLFTQEPISSLNIQSLTPSNKTTTSNTSNHNTSHNNRYSSNRSINHNSSPPKHNANKSSNFNAKQETRMIELKLLICFFGKYSNMELNEFSRLVTQGLPVLMHRATNDSERELVFELALHFQRNEALITCANSILLSNCKSIRLIELSYQYLTLFPTKSTPNDIELLLLDVLHRRDEEFIILAFLSYFKSQLNLIEINKQFVEKIRNLIIYTMKSKKSSILLRAARVDIVNSINGKDAFLDFTDFTKEVLRQRSNNCSSNYDQERIKTLKIQLANSSSKSPIYDSPSLWGNKAHIHEVYYQGFPHSKAIYGNSPNNQNNFTNNSCNHVNSLNIILNNGMTCDNRDDVFHVEDDPNTTLDSEDYLSADSDTPQTISPKGTTSKKMTAEKAKANQLSLSSTYKSRQVSTSKKSLLSRKSNGRIIRSSEISKNMSLSSTRISSLTKSSNLIKNDSNNHQANIIINTSNTNDNKINTDTNPNPNTIKALNTKVTNKDNTNINGSNNNGNNNSSNSNNTQMIMNNNSSKPLISNKDNADSSPSNSITIINNSKLVINNKPSNITNNSNNTNSSSSLSNNINNSINIIMNNGCSPTSGDKKKVSLPSKGPTIVFSKESSTLSSMKSRSNTNLLDKSTKPTEENQENQSKRVSLKPRSRNKSLGGMQARAEIGHIQPKKTGKKTENSPKKVENTAKIKGSNSKGLIRVQNI
ncbi:hypothetical protein TRFO_24857 [Tritrichomonas foetus]|uniref:Uncharacterized protein n=1 Tax=Tritrichomonas foetus TaxID=1144522 RepID=A0A1J4K6A2_9EUKA|nr:hypothetical protein TRFO_24857 [Tritrichomonas foetus]|eukprot:OHT06977.1 hypothetical protein TRFO_24857 [Tritrichomonas foetus]